MRVDLINGAYVGRSIIANDQRCINLFLEQSPGDSPFPTAHYPCPGLIPLATAPTVGWRGLYTAKPTNDLYGVCGNTVYYISPSWALTALGTIGTAAGPVGIADNGFTALIVDGTTTGYTIDLTTRAFARVTDPNFYGATHVDTADTYFVLNRPGTNDYYISLTNQVAFDPLDIAAKTSQGDHIVALKVMHDEIWLLGSQTSEVHYDTGASDFTFGKMPGVFIEHGCAAPYSVAKYDASLYWLAQNAQGDRIVMRGNSYQAQRISTHAIEAELGKYATVSDAIGFAYQIGGHSFYQLTFPSADVTWVFDEATKLWHQRTWTDGDGVPHRHRANCESFAYGRAVCGDWQTGALYALDLDTYTDFGAPIVYLRTFPHEVNNSDRVTYRRFVADMEVGNASSASPTPMASLRWSDDRGATFGTPIMMSLGAAGQYATSMQWRGLGMARDRVFELSWSAPVKTCLNGAWVDIKPHRT